MGDSGGNSKLEQVAAELEVVQSAVAVREQDFIAIGKVYGKSGDELLAFVEGGLEQWERQEAQSAEREARVQERRHQMQIRKLELKSAKQERIGQECERRALKGERGGESRFVDDDDGDRLGGAGWMAVPKFEDDVSRSVRGGHGSKPSARKNLAAVTASGGDQHPAGRIRLYGGL